MKFCDRTSENGVFSDTQTDRQTDTHADGQTVVEVEIVTYLDRLRTIYALLQGQRKGSN